MKVIVESFLPKKNCINWFSINTRIVLFLFDPRTSKAINLSPFPYILFHLFLFYNLQFKSQLVQVFVDK